jgi:peptidoglycan lytic transglycosylase G
MRRDEMIDQRLEFAWEEDEPRRRRSGPPSRQQRRRRKKRRRQKGKSYGALIISLVLLLVVGVGIYWGIDQVQNNQSIREFLSADFEQGDMGEEVTFAVKEGDSGSVIASNLLEQDVIKSQAAFVQVCDNRKSECQAIQPGNYPVQKHSPAETVFNILIDPTKAVASSFTIREGLSVIQTLQRLSEQTQIPLADFQAAIADPAALGITPDWYARQDGKPAATTSVEGFLFPDTYRYDPTATATDILKLMVNQFMAVAQELQLPQQAASRGIGVYELIIAASIAQVEVKEPDFPKAVRVIYNRAYREEMNLGMDSTANYWLELNGQATQNSGNLTGGQLDDASNPYNTGNSSVGMPIGPISNPGRAALQAATSPADGDWLYFVAIDENTTLFADTDAEHCANIATAIANGANLQPC